MEIMERVREIGEEGAKIGLLAARGVLKMFVSDYDEGDLKREIDELNDLDWF
jgi:hypothetical protein